MTFNKTAVFSKFGDLSRQDSGRFAVILAGGDGTRLKSLTQMISGDERPKQFCSILNGETLLGLTQKRVALKIRPENILYSLTQKHERFYKSLLNDVSSERLVIQPINKGTAPAILYSLLRLAKNAPDATVAFFPSDHYFSDDAAFMNNVETAFGAVKFNSDSIVLIGITPETAETSYGWIEPVESIFGNQSKSVSRVKQFWEKPKTDSAEYLFEKGCLWNSFVMVGKVSTFLDLFKKHLSELYDLFKTLSLSVGINDKKSVVRSIYRQINEINFSSEVLEKATKELFVLRVDDVVWSDWGEPKRVLGTLESLNIQPEWMAYAV